jgi:hypothetical protein
VVQNVDPNEAADQFPVQHGSAERSEDEVRFCTGTRLWLNAFPTSDQSLCF